MFPIRTILHPTDFAEHSQHALKAACLLAQDFGAELVLVHVAEPGSSYAPSRGIPSRPAWAHLAAADGNADHTVRIVRLKDTDDRAARILEIAEESGANLIVLGANGDVHPDRPLTNELADLVLQKLTCPLLLVKSPPVVNSQPARQDTQATGVSR